MGENLKPCPFCKGEASLRLFYKGKYRVHCNVCDAHTGDVCDTEAEAIVAWNTRAERTCMNVSGTQHMFRCSLCGDVWAKPDVDLFAYCPTCGAKVVERGE